MCHVLIDFAHSWLCGAGFVGFRRRGRRRSGPCRKRSSPRSGVHRPCKPSSLAAAIVTTPRGGTAAAGISAATSGTMVLVGSAPSTSTPLAPPRSGAIIAMASVVSYPRALNPVYPRLEPPRRLGAPRARRGVSCGFGAARPGLHRFGAGGVPTSPNFRAGAATVSPGFAGGGFHGGLAAAIFITFTAPEFPTSARLPRRVLPRRRLPWAWRGHRSPYRRACLPRFCGRRGFPCRRRLPWAWRGHRSPHRRACLPRFCGRRGFPCRAAAASMGLAAAEGRTSARQPRQVLAAAAFMALEGAGISRRRGVRTGRHRTSLSAPQAGSSSANTLTSATTSEPSAISATLVKRKAASAPDWT